MQPLEVERSPLDIGNLFNTKKPSRSFFEKQLSLDQENIKGFQLIEARAREIREKEKRDRDIIKKFKNIFEDQVKKFQQLQKVSSQALQQKTRQLELLSIQNTQLKDERVELQTAKDEKQLLSLQHQQLQKENLSLKNQIAEITEKYNELKVDFDQKSELLQNGIKNSKIEAEESSLRNIPGSMREIEQLNNELQAQKKKQIEEAIAKEEEKLTSKSLEISSILETFLESVSNPYGNSSESKYAQKNTLNAQEKLQSLTEDLKRKSDDISRLIANLNQLQINLRDRETDILRLGLNLQDQQKKLKEKDNNILALKKELQTFDQKEVNRLKEEETKRQNTMKSYETLQHDITDLLKTKTLEQYKNFYDLLISTTSQIFTTLKLSLLQSTSALPSSIMKILDLNMIYLNDFFTDISKQQNEKTRRMNQYISKAKNITEKRFSFEEQSDLDRDFLAESTPDRYGGIRDYQRKWEGSQDSGKSEHRGSVLLSNQMGSANNYEEFMEQLKTQAFQQELSQHDLTNSQIILDNLKEGTSMDFSTFQGGLNDSISNSQISTYSQAEQTLAHNEKKKSVILNAKLKRKKKV